MVRDFEDRKRIRCPHANCRLVQFVNTAKTCRRCKRAFEKPKPAPVAAVKVVVKPGNAGKVMDVDFWLAFAFHDERRRKELTMQQVADRMGVCRSYLTKIEHGQVAPTIKSIFSICNALEVDTAYLIRRVEFLTFGK